MQETERERLERYEKKKINKLQHKTQAEGLIPYHSQQDRMTCGFGS